jgi:hypothetical protein
MCSESMQEVRVCMLEYFYNVTLKIAPENPFKEQIYYISGSNYGGLNYKTPFYEDCALKYRKNCYKI